MSHLNLSNFYKILMKPYQHFLRIGVFKGRVDPYVEENTN